MVRLRAAADDINKNPLQQTGRAWPFFGALFPAPDDRRDLTPVRTKPGEAALSQNIGTRPVSEQPVIMR